MKPKSLRVYALVAMVVITTVYLFGTPQRLATVSIYLGEGGISSQSLGVVHAQSSPQYGNYSGYINVTVARIDIHQTGVNGTDGLWICVLNTTREINIINIHNTSIYICDAPLPIGHYNALRMWVQRIRLGISNAVTGFSLNLDVVVPTEMSGGLQITFGRSMNLRMFSRRAMHLDLRAPSTSLVGGRFDGYSVTVKESGVW